MTLTDFMLARIAEDEAQASSVHLFDCVLDHVDGREGCSCVIPAARILAECQAKRRVTELHRGRWEPAGECDACGDRLPCPTIVALASAYADHPDWCP